MRLARDIAAIRAPLLGFLLMGLGWGTFAAYVPELKSGLAASDAAFGLLLLWSSVGLVTAMWLAPRLDAAAGARALPIAASGLALAYLGPGLAGTMPDFAAAMLALGVLAGLTDVVMNARISEIEAACGRPLMNLAHAAFSGAYALAALASGPAREAGLPAIAMLGAVAVAGLLAAPRMAGAIPAAEPEAGAGGYPGAVVLWGGAIVLVGFFVENAVEAWSALHVERTLGGAPAEGALGPAVLGLTMGAGRLAGHVAAGRWSDTRVLFCASLLASAGLLVAAAAPGPVVAYAGFAAAGLGVSVIAPTALALVGRSVPAAARTRAIARAAVIGFAGFFLGPGLMGGVSELAGLRVALAMAALVLVAVPPLVRLTLGAAGAPRRSTVPPGHPR